MEEGGRGNVRNVDKVRNGKRNNEREIKKGEMSVRERGSESKREKRPIVRERQTKGVIERETERVNSPRIITGADM